MNGAAGQARRLAGAFGRFLAQPGMALVVAGLAVMGLAAGTLGRPRPVGADSGRGVAWPLVFAGPDILAAQNQSAPGPATGPGGPATTQPVARPTQRVANCTAGGCHAGQINYKVLHGPTAIGACDTCHEYVDPAAHTFKQKREDAKLCTFCHVGQEVGKVIHKPVADGQCLGCHNPHGAANKQMLRSENAGQMCASCHGDVTRARKNVHGPIATGNCATCHNSHSSEFPHLLTAQGRDLCLGCHNQMGQQLAAVKFVHKPAEGDCLQCHEAHASDHTMQLKLAPLDLCESCHADVKQQAQAAARKHSVVTTGQACATCHTPHGSDLAKLMKDEPVRLCLTCHDQPIVQNGQTTVAAVAEIAAKDQFKHGPIRDGDCAGCHQAHGGDLARLLAAPYTQAFYQAFSLDAYELCFRCHDKQLVLTAQTRGLTDFRDGETNLHYLHVNKPERGRSCRACHSTHASKHPLHIRDSVPFGNWQMPINFKPTPNGGGCSPGCHKPLSYDRASPLNPSPTTAPDETAPPRPLTVPRPVSPPPAEAPASATPRPEAPAPASTQEARP